MSDGWYGFDLDHTLARREEDSHAGPLGAIGPPIPAMVVRVKALLDAGEEVRIFTARVADPHYGQIAAYNVGQWCLQHLGRILPVTCCKDERMIEVYDDRARQVVPNTGEVVGE